MKLKFVDAVVIIITTMIMITLTTMVIHLQHTAIYYDKNISDDN